MNEKDKIILGTLAGVDLILSPEHYEEYKGTLNKQIETINKELDQYKNNWEELKKWLDRKREGYQKAYIDIPYVLNKMKELEEDK